MPHPGDGDGDLEQRHLLQTNRKITGRQKIRKEKRVWQKKSR